VCILDIQFTEYDQNDFSKLEERIKAGYKCWLAIRGTKSGHAITAYNIRDNRIVCQNTWEGAPIVTVYQTDKYTFIVINSIKLFDLDAKNVIPLKGVPHISFQGNEIKQTNHFLSRSTKFNRDEADDSSGFYRRREKDDKSSKQPQQKEDLNEISKDELIDDLMNLVESRNLDYNILCTEYGIKKNQQIF